MIDLDKFYQPIISIVPIIDNKFILRKKAYKSPISVEDGWYRISAKGNIVSFLENISLENIEMISNWKKELSVLDIIRGYVYNSSIVFQNFGNSRKIIGEEVIKSIYLCNQENFTPIYAFIGYLGELYYYKPDYKNYISYEVKQAFDKKEDYQKIKGITPELRTLCLFMEMERQKMEQEKYKESLEGKLVNIFRLTGAILLSYTVREKDIIVNWQLGEDIFNSVIEKDTFRVQEAGYCMSGADKKHNLSSAILLAKDYQENNLIYTTRV